MRSTARARSSTPSRPNPYQWNVTGHDGTVRIVYKVFGNRVDGTYLGVDDVARAHEHAGDADVGARLRHAAGARHVSSRRPDCHWKPATQLFPTDDPWTFTAPNLQYLMDSPTELSDYTLRSFKVHNPDGKEFTIRTAVHHDGDRRRRRRVRRGRREDRQRGGGGIRRVSRLRHRHLHVPRRLRAVGRRRRHGAPQQHGRAVADLVQESAGSARACSARVSHEFFHCWNVERIRPKTLEPFDFEDANISGELWLAEGFTQYYGPLIMARAGLVDRRPAVRTWPACALTVINSPARQFRSAVEMSQMAPFTDAARVDRRNQSRRPRSSPTTPTARRSRLALDLSLRDRSDGKLTLDDYMRAMWIAHGKPGGPQPGLVAKPYTLKDARDRLAEVSGDRAFADEFFDKYIEGRELAGLRSALRPSRLVRRRIQAAWAGVLDQNGASRYRRGRGGVGCDTNRYRRQIPDLVTGDTPAFDAGLEEET